MERKLKTCSDCGKSCHLWKSYPKLCKECAGKPKYKKPSKKPTEVKQGLNVFFASQALEIPKHCENCGEELNAFTSFQKRCVTAHILPKKENGGFPVVSTHPKNRMFLGVYCGCHGEWDNKGAEDRAAMNVYPKAIERFQEFKGLLSQAELIKAKKYLNINK